MTSTQSSPLTPSAPTPDNSPIDYGVVREDPRLELSVIEELSKTLGRPLRTAVVASGGCTALTLLATEAVETVCAIDMNFSQIALVELRRAALSEFTLEEQKTLLGVDAKFRPERLELYKRLRERLPEEVRSFFDARQDDLVRGLESHGKLELLFRELRDAFATQGLDPTLRPAQALGHESWGALFATTFSQGRLEQLFGTEAFAYANRPFHEHLSESFANALRRFKVSDNPYLAQILDADANPFSPYWTPEVQAQILDLGPYRLTTHHGPLIGRLQELSSDARFDFIQISDLTDWVPTPERHRLLRAVKDALNPGGALLARRLNGANPLAPTVAQHLRTDAAKSAELLATDRSFLYQEVVVAYKEADA